MPPDTGLPYTSWTRIKYAKNCRKYKKAFSKSFGSSGSVLYASKANCFKRIYEIMSEEEMGIDVVSSGEIYTAIRAGYDLSKAYFHSNNKTDWDIAYAMDNNIGCFVADNIEEIRVIEREAEKTRYKAKKSCSVSRRALTLTLMPLFHGEVDSKFGSAIETGQARK